MSEGMYGDLVRRLHDRGGRVAVDSSGGPLRGALPGGPDLIKPDRVDRPRSTVGAGDCTLAGYLLASERGAHRADALATAVAFGAAAVALPGSKVPTPAQVRAVEPVVSRDPDLRLSLTD